MQVVNNARLSKIPSEVGLINQAGHSPFYPFYWGRAKENLKICLLLFGSIILLFQPVARGIQSADPTVALSFIRWLASRCLSLLFLVGFGGRENGLQVGIQSMCWNFGRLLTFSHQAPLQPSHESADVHFSLFPFTPRQSFSIFSPCKHQCPLLSPNCPPPRFHFHCLRPSAVLQGLHSPLCFDKYSRYSESTQADPIRPQMQLPQLQVEDPGCRMTQLCL